MDYVEYANLSSYLFNTVRQRFAKQGYLTAFDFFSIVIWKANRAKSNVANQIKRNSDDSLEDLVYLLTWAIANANTPKDKLKILRKMGLRLPMASAILTVLYPEEFTIYDVRVRKVLGITEKIGNTSNFELLWTRYQDYKAKVIANTPSGLSLREKDQYLWGKSRYDQLIEDIKNGVPPRKKQDNDEDSSDV